MTYMPPEHLPPNIVSLLQPFLDAIEEHPPTTTSSLGLWGASRCLEVAAYAMAQHDHPLSVAQLILIAHDLERLSQGKEPRANSPLQYA